jgi:L-aminopeptidase/D-esterase-like protein
VHDDDPFRSGSLTDVAGVLVGHHRRLGRGWQTGTTVVHCPDGAVAAVDVRGGGPGTRETDALDPSNLVDRIHAICLSGGSAYGLSTADGVMAELERRRLGVPVGPAPTHVVPVVPTAVVFDLGRGGDFLRRPGPAFGERALRNAHRRAGRGSVGAGTGARAGGLQGGVGMASAVVDLDGVRITVAALAVVNAAGTPIDPTTGTPWTAISGLRRPSRDDRAAVAAIVSPPVDRPADQRPGHPLNTTIGVVATDAALTRPEAKRFAMSAHDGLARAIRPAHGLTDGDTVFALSTGARDLAWDADDVAGLARGPSSRAVRVGRLHAAGADVFERACVDAVVTATTVGDVPAYRDVCPSAWRSGTNR